ncbi:prolyl oligopeptidase family serine peptidase [Streptomyces tsukubensis]
MSTSTTQDYLTAEQLLHRPARPGQLVVGDKVRLQWQENAVEFAALGFVPVAVDGRGTPGHSKAFHDFSDGRPADHVAALRQPAGNRLWMDLDRVGVLRDSGGGYAAVPAMADFPEVYKAGAALSGSHDAPTSTSVS